MLTQLRSSFLYFLTVSVHDVVLNVQSVACRCLLSFEDNECAICGGLKVSMSHVIFSILTNYGLQTKLSKLLKRNIAILTAKYALFCSFEAKLSQNSLLVCIAKCRVKELQLK